MILDWELAPAESLCQVLGGQVRAAWGDSSLEMSEVLLRELRLARARDDSTTGTLGQDLLRIRRQCLPPEDVRLVPALLEQARVLMKGGGHDDARACLDESFRILGTSQAADSLLLAETHHEMAVLLLDRRDPAAAEPHLRQAGRLRRRLLGERDRNTARTRLFLGICKFQLKRVSEARRDYEAAVHTLESVLGSRHPDYLWALNAYASFLQSRGELKRARDAYDYVLRVKRELGLPEDVSFAWTLNNLAVIAQESRDFARAESLYSEACRIREARLGRHPLTARSLTSCGSMLFLRGDFLQARELLEKALVIFRQWKVERDADAGLCLFNLGMVYDATGDLDAAQDYYQQAQRVLGEKGRPQDLMACLRGLARCRLARRQPAAAESLYRAVLDIAPAKLRADAARAGMARIDLGCALSAQGRYGEADSELVAGLAGIERSAGPSSFPLGLASHSYAREMLRRGKFLQASDAFQRSNRILKADLAPDHPLLVRGWIGLAQASRALGRPAAARELALKAHRLEMRHLNENVGYMTEQHALLYREALESASDLAVLLLAADPAPVRRQVSDAWEAVLNGRGLVLDELMDREREANRARGDPAYQAFVAARTRLSNLYVRGPGSTRLEQYQEILKKAVREREQAEKTWAASTAGRRHRGPARITLTQALKKLPADAVLLAYVRYSQETPGNESPPRAAYGAFVGRGSGEVTFVPLAPADSVEQTVDALREHLSRAADQLRLDPGRAERDYFSIGDRLRRMIWDPVAPRLGRADRIVLVPDGVLHLVSFPSLPTRPGRFLVEEPGLICPLSTERDLLRPQAPSGTGLLALGDPDFDASSDRKGSRTPPALASVVVPAGRASDPCRPLEGIRFDALPATGEEARRVADLASTLGNLGGKPLVLVGAGAGEAAVKRLAPGRRVLHLATHGLFLDEHCLDAGSGQDVPPTRSLGLRSGLALAGANLRARTPAGGEDGILTAEEVGGLNLTGVDLVVLSACNSGQGMPARAEGASGLRRAFQVSGARALVASLWPVADRITGEWMKAFYRARWNEGESTAGAVRQASRAMLELRRGAGAGSHPFYWGSFISIGADWSEPSTGKG